MAGFGSINKWGGLAAAGLGLAGCHFGSRATTPGEVAAGTEGSVSAHVRSAVNARQSRESDIALNRVIRRGDDAMSLYCAISAQPASDAAYVLKHKTVRVTLPATVDFEAREGNRLEEREMPAMDAVRKLDQERQRLLDEMNRAADAVGTAFGYLDRDQQIEARLALGSWSEFSNKARDRIEEIDAKARDRLRLL